MFKPLSLRLKVALLLAALLAVSTLGGLGTLWFINRTQSTYTEIMDRDITALAAAHGLMSALASQKGYVTDYLSTDDPEWLDRMNEHHQAFEHWISRARQSALEEGAHTVLNRIEAEYLRLAFDRGRIVELHQQSREQESAAVHVEYRDRFKKIYELCQDYKRLHERSIAASREEYDTQTRTVAALAWVALSLSAGACVLLAWILFRNILGPIRRLALSPGGQAPGPADAPGFPDEVEALASKVRGLIGDVEQAQGKLDASRQVLAQSEKMATVGKLAAGVAHSIRNPLTSVKMRLFSLERSLELDVAQKEDFAVVAEEIGHIDTIVHNFLEFARRPKLKFRRMDPAEVVDMTLLLLNQRLESGGIKVRFERPERAPHLAIDAEQLKEAFANLLLNALEVMPGGGRIDISMEEGVLEPLGRAVVFRFSDNGPGIAPDIQEKIFEPFFSTKEEGSGLGLSIVRRIVEGHGGWLHVHSKEGDGATFVIALPCERRETWLRS